MAINRNIHSRIYRKLSFVLLFVAAISIGMPCSPLQAAAPPERSAQPIADSMKPDRQTTEGIVIGSFQKSTHTLSWKAIPYALPPVGDLRWQAPRPPEKRPLPLAATDCCRICPQYIDHDHNPATPYVVSGTEDCLYLNIWRPRTREVGLPVFVWIHGGSNTVQWPLLSDTDGAFLANRQNLVVVTVSYRLGPLGFFSHPALRHHITGEEKTDSGNFALLDLIQALSWIQSNISVFGGNPDNVTIAGQDAGGGNVLSLLVSPLAKGLFHRAICQSGMLRQATPDEGAAHVETILTRLLLKDGKAQSEQEAAAVIRDTPQTELEAYLRSKSAQDLLGIRHEGKIGGMYRLPANFGDGAVLPEDFSAALSAGRYNKVAVLLGSNRDEAKLSLMLGNPAFNVWAQEGSLFKNPVEAELYDLVAKYQSDAWKAMSVDHPARIMRRHKDQPMIYAYQFLWGSGGKSKSVLPHPYNLLAGACHAMEIDFVFGTEAIGLGSLAFTGKNRPGRTALSQAVMDYWGQFARTGHPNREGSGLPRWRPWSNEDGEHKTILLDADFNGLNMDSSDQELTQEAILKELKSEGRVKEIMPFWESFLHRQPAR